MVSFNAKRIKIYYAAVITEVINAETYGVSFMRLITKENMKYKMPLEPKYKMPLEPDLSKAHIKDIKMILPLPQVNGTKTRNSTYIFPIRVTRITPNLILR